MSELGITETTLALTALLLGGWLAVDVYVLRILWPVRKLLGRIPTLVRRAELMLDEKCPHCGGDL
jgi:hypothetical protein